MIRPLSLAGALIVTSDMRPEDAACVRALSGRDPGEWFAIDRYRAPGLALEVLQDGKPWAMTGIELPSAWTAVIWLVARPGLSRHSWRKLIRQGRTVLANAADPACPEYRHRIEAHVLEGWHAAAQFAAALGFVHEGTRRQAGAGGENLQTWVRLGPVKGN